MHCPMSMTPATNMPRSISLFHFQTCFLDYTPSKVYVVMHPTNQLPLCHFWCVFFSYRYFLSYWLFTVSGALLQTPAIITPWLGSHTHPIFLQLYVQGTCNYCSIIKEAVSNFFFLLHCIHCLCGYMSKAPVTITPSLMRLFLFFITPHPLFLCLYVQGSCIYYSTLSHINLFFDFTLFNVSLAIHPKHLQLY